MRVTFLQQGISFVIGDYSTVPAFAAPIGPNIRQLVRFTEVGTDTSLSVYVVTDVNGTTESGHTVSLKNVYDGMLFDLSSLAPLLGKDIVRRINDTWQRAGVKLTATVRFTTPKGKALSFYVYPCGSVRLGNTGAANTFSEYNYARAGQRPVLTGGPLTEMSGGPVAGFYDGVRYAGNVSNGQFLGNMVAPVAVPGVKFDRATISVYIRNSSTTGYIRVGVAGSSEVARVAAGETKRVELPFVALSEGFEPKLDLYSFDTGYADVIFSRMALNSGGCAAAHSLGDTDMTNRLGTPYIGYLTDYRDGYFNYMAHEELGARRAGSFPLSGGITSTTGAVFLNSIYFPSMAGFFMRRWQIDKNGALVTQIESDYRSGGRTDTNSASYGQDCAYIWDSSSNPGYHLYGVERYKKKLYYDEPLEKKIILRWLNSRGAWDSMYFVNFKMTPQTNSTGTVDSIDFNVSVVIDWDNEEALYYLTRSPHIMALTPADVGQWGWATSESNGVFALQGGNIGKTLNLKFNYKINQA